MFPHDGFIMMLILSSGGTDKGGIHIHFDMKTYLCSQSDTKCVLCISPTCKHLCLLLAVGMELSVCDRKRL